MPIEDGIRWKDLIKCTGGIVSFFSMLAIQTYIMNARDKLDYGEFLACLCAWFISVGMLSRMAYYFQKKGWIYYLITIIVNFYAFYSFAFGWNIHALNYAMLLVFSIVFNLSTLSAFLKFSSQQNHILIGTSIFFVIIKSYIEFWKVYTSMDPGNWHEHLVEGINSMANDYLTTIAFAIIVSYVCTVWERKQDKDFPQPGISSEDEYVDRNLEKKAPVLIPYSENSTIEIYKGSYTMSIKLFDLLQVIVGKVCSVFLILNGGAAVAVMAFVGHIMGLESDIREMYLNGILHSLACFAIGALNSTLLVMFSYFSQSMYCRDAEQQRVQTLQYLKNGQETADGKVVMMDHFESGNQCAKRKGDIYRNIASACGLISATCFLAGTYIFYHTFVF